MRMGWRLMDGVDDLAECCTYMRGRRVAIGGKSLGNVQFKFGTRAVHSQLPALSLESSGWKLWQFCVQTRVITCTSSWSFILLIVCNTVVNLSLYSECQINFIGAFRSFAIVFATSLWSYNCTFWWTEGVHVGKVLSTQIEQNKKTFLPPQ